MNEFPHIIKRVHLRVNTPSSENKAEVYQLIKELWNQKIEDSLMIIFDQLTNPEDIVKIQRIAVKVPSIKRSELLDEFPKTLLETLNDSLAKKLNNTTSEIAIRLNGYAGVSVQVTGIEKSSVKKASGNWFLFFLRNGYANSWSYSNTRSAMMDEISGLLRKEPSGTHAGNSFLNQLTQLLHGKKSSLIRLVKQFPNSFLSDVYEAIKGSLSGRYYSLDSIVNEVLAIMQDSLNAKNLSNFQKERTTWYIKLKVLLDLDEGEQIMDDFSGKYGSKVIQQISSKELLELQPTNKLGEEYSTKKSLFHKDPIKIGNSGLVLLIPFLGRLLEKVGLIKSQEFLSVHAQEKAVLLLQYIITGNVKENEEALVLNKILCALPLEYPVEMESIVDESHKEICHTLLSSVIEHWTAINNTNIDWVRQMFLQRQGSLVKDEHGFLLTVEQQAQDILLESLPWSYSIIKLPWMDQMIRVKWI